MSGRVGAHTASRAPLDEAAERSADLVQIFLSNPQSWKKPLPRPDADDLRSSAIPIYVHAPYLINPVSDNNRVRIPSRRILQETCDAAAEIGAAGVVVHGGHVTGDGDIGEAYPRWRKALTQLDSPVPVLIENTAGGDRAVLRTVEDARHLWAEIGDLGPGFVLDTCHAWAASEPLDEVSGRFREATGRLDLIHCNDSRDPFGSNRDRHANLGAGQIPLDLLAATVVEAAAPVVVETPGPSSAQAADIAWVRRTIEASC